MTTPSHLNTAKLEATEQCWVAELVVFDYTVRYHPGRNNRNADALSRQCLPQAEVAACPTRPGTPVPETVQRAVADAGSTVQHVISAAPERSTEDLIALQRADPAIGAVLLFFQQRRMPGHVERQRLRPAVLGLLRQWDRLTMRNGLLYRMHQLPDGGEGVYQLVLPESLREAIFQQLHTHHGHQGIKHTTELIQQRCYSPGMGKVIRLVLKV